MTILFTSNFIYIMPLKQLLNLFKNIFNSSNRKLLIIELKLEFRKLKTSFTNLRLSLHLRKFYLLFLVLALLIPLFSISPSAYQDNSKLLKLVDEIQVDKDQKLTFAEPLSVIPNITSSDSKEFSKYKIKTNENIDSLTSRLTNLSKESILVNNPGKEIKEGNEIVIPNQNGLLVGYNNQTNTKELSIGLEMPEIDLVNIIKKEKEGYIFKKTDNPANYKKELDTRITRSRYSISNSTRVDIIPSSINGVSSALPGEDLSEALNSFITNFKGRRHHDGNGWSMGECVSLVKRWQQSIGAAYGIWPGYNGYPRNAWAGYRSGNKGMAPDNATYGVMVVSDVNSLKPGDILVINTATSHTGIATGRYNGDSYEVFDQNSPVGSSANFNNYSKSSFIAALRYYRK
jgi:hypothetical protein